MSRPNAIDAANIAQSLAADPLASVFVTANAGSGKTKVLVDRIARLLLAGSPPSAFLCITYTKAAAAEMQRRLFERLGQWCVADDETLAKDLTKLDAPPRDKADLGIARGLFARALESPGGLRIQTIHAFCERLLARFPLEAGVAPGFDIADEARAGALLQMARAHSVLGGDDATAAAFARFAAKLHGDGLDALLDRLVLRRANFRDFAQANGGGLSALQRLRLRHGVVLDVETHCAAYLEAAPWPQLRDAAVILASSTTADQNVADRIGEAFTAREGALRDAVMALLRIVLTDKFEPYKRMVTNPIAAKHAWIERLFSDLADASLAALEQLNAIDRADDARAALTLALKLDAEYGAAKARFGALDFEDLIAHAQQLLTSAEAAPWVLYKLDGGLDHILIDEGQDTSPGQWELIAPLQNEFFAGLGVRDTPRTVFAVGDPKQSIYAFQGADPKRFLAESQALSARAQAADRKFVAPILETSFRSSPEVLRAVDAAFEGRELTAAAPGQYDETRHLAARENEPGVVEVWPLALRPARAEGKPWDAPLDVEIERSAPATLAKAVAREVKNWIDQRYGVWEKGALRPMHAGDVLALVRTRGQLFRELIKAFKRVGLPVAGADRMILKDELAVEDCLALIRVALDPADDLAVACVLKGPWCDLDDDDADIFPLAYGRAKGETLHARLMASGDAKYAPAKAFVAEIIARRGDDAFVFLSWALEAMTADGRSGWTRVLARVGPEARDPLEELLARALRPSPYTAPSLQRFLYDIETDSGEVKREMEAAGGAVRVMTVHGAKGLEAPVVILPDCTAAVSDRPEDGLLFSEEGPFIAGAQKLDDEATRRARDAHKARAASENLRLLYVAMTRARDRLVVCGAEFGNSKTGEVEDSWRLVVEKALTKLDAQKCDTPFGDGLRLGEPRIAQARETVAAPIVALPAWIKAATSSAKPAPAAPSRLRQVDPAVFSPRGEGQTRFRRGRLIHGLLERLPEIAPERRRDAALRWLQRQGVDANEASALAGEALAVIETPSFSAAFGPSSRAEAPLVGDVKGRPVRGIIDRLAIDESGVLVLDYKTDRPAPALAQDVSETYLLQMALYREVMRKIFPKRTIRCALLWTESPRLMELPDKVMDAVLATFPGS